MRSLGLGLGHGFGLSHSHGYGIALSHGFGLGLSHGYGLGHTHVYGLGVAKLKTSVAMRNVEKVNDKSYLVGIRLPQKHLFCLNLLFCGR